MSRRPPRSLVAVSFLAVPLAAIGVGCDTAPPVVRIDDAIVERTSDDHARLLVRLSIHNPNDVPVALEEFHYRVGPYTGLRRPGVSLAPNAETALELPAVVPLDSVESTISASGRVAWVPTGVISRSLHDTRVVRRRSSFAGAVAIE